MLKLSFGYNKLQSYDYSQNSSNDAKFLELYLNPILNYWMSLIFIVIPVIIALIIKIK